MVYHTFKYGYIISHLAYTDDELISGRPRWKPCPSSWDFSRITMRSQVSQSMPARAASSSIRSMLAPGRTRFGRLRISPWVPCPSPILGFTCIRVLPRRTSSLALGRGYVQWSMLVAPTPHFWRSSCSDQEHSRCHSSPFPSGHEVPQGHHAPARAAHGLFLLGLHWDI